MIAAPGSTRVAEDENALGVIHEGGGLSEVRRGGAVFDEQPIALADDASRAAGDFGDHVGAEALNDLVERAGYGREGSELLDQPIAASDRLAAFDRLAVAIDGPGREVAFGVGKRLVELDWERVGEIVEDILTRRDIDL